MDDRRYWVGFTLVKGVGAVRLQALLDYFGTAESAWSASPFDLVAAGLSPKLAGRVIQVRNSLNLDEVLAQAEKSKLRLLSWDDAEDPTHLKEIDQPLPVLYLRGEVAAEDGWSAAMVGTRAVPGSGVDKIYPPEHRSLAEKGMSQERSSAIAHPEHRPKAPISRHAIAASVDYRWLW
jgi:DNA processing protein